MGGAQKVLTNQIMICKPPPTWAGRPCLQQQSRIYTQRSSDLVFVYCYERNVRIRLRRPANSGYTHTATAAGRAASSTHHHRVPTLHMSTAGAGGAGR